MTGEVAPGWYRVPETCAQARERRRVPRRADAPIWDELRQPPGPRNAVRGPAEADDTLRNAGIVLSLAEAARRYGKSPHTLRAAIQAGDLRAHKVGRRRYQLYPADIDAWIRGARVE